MATLLGRTPQKPRQIPPSNLSSQWMNDVVSVLTDPFFFTSDVQHELRKRHLNVSGAKNVLLQRLFEALEAEYAKGWTSGYLLNTRIVPFPGTGRDPKSLIGHHVQGYRCDGDSVITIELSDGEDVTILSDKTSKCAKIKIDDEIFWSLHTLDGMKAVPRNLASKPLLIVEAATGVRKDRWGEEAGTVFGLKLEGMRAISFFSLAGGSSIREDRTCGNVWLSENRILHEDLGMLHGMMVEEVKEERLMVTETRGLEEDMRDLHGN